MLCRTGRLTTRQHAVMRPQTWPTKVDTRPLNLSQTQPQPGYATRQAEHTWKAANCRVSPESMAVPEGQPVTCALFISSVMGDTEMGSNGAARISSLPSMASASTTEVMALEAGAARQGEGWGGSDSRR